MASKLGLNTLDIHRGSGTAFQGVLNIPKPQGVRKGWVKQFGVISGNRFFMYGFGDQGRQPLVSCLANYCLWDLICAALNPDW
jgi:hypothetical protein